jgi:hypothetical protein
MLSPLNVQDGLSVTGTSTFTSQANFTGGLSASTFSANTYQNLPSFNSAQINGTPQFSGDTNNFINFSGINITITSAATNTLVFSADTGGGGGVTSVTAGTGLSGNSTTGVITLITNISASSISNSTTVGQNLITIPNPSEIRYLRINADNSITTLTLAQLKSDLGLGSAVVSTDQTTVSAVYQNVTDLTFEMTAGKRYKWRATIWVTTTTTANFSTNGPAGTTIYRFTLGSGQSTNLVNNNTANNTGPVVGVGNNRIVSADGIYVASASGTFNVSMISLSTGGVVVKAGSIIEYEEVL